MRLLPVHPSSKAEGAFLWKNKPNSMTGSLKICVHPIHQWLKNNSHLIARSNTSASLSVLGERPAKTQYRWRRNDYSNACLRQHEHGTPVRMCLEFKWIAFSSHTRYNSNMPILKLKTSDEVKELEFELDYQSRLTTQERFKMMLAKSQQMARLLQRNGRRRTTQIIKRT